MILLHKNLLRSFRNAILTELWARRSQSCSYIYSTFGPVAVEVWQLHTKKSPVISFFGFVYLQSLERLVYCLFSIEIFVAALVQAFSSHCTLLILRAKPMYIDKWRVYGLSVAACFVENLSTVDPGVFLLIYT